MYDCSTFLQKNRLQVPLSSEGMKNLNNKSAGFVRQTVIWAADLHV
jgi:hypothetical protein